MEKNTDIQAEVAKQVQEQIKAVVEPLKEKIMELERDIQINPMNEKIADLVKQLDKGKEK
ncbi:MAG TPA: hypothetical protein VGE40_09240 [Bacilli bacterium]